LGADLRPPMLPDFSLGSFSQFLERECLSGDQVP
jgi:hypothetical protein